MTQLSNAALCIVLNFLFVKYLFSRKSDHEWKLVEILVLSLDMGMFGWNARKFADARERYFVKNVRYFW